MRCYLKMDSYPGACLHLTARYDSVGNTPFPLYLSRHSLTIVLTKYRPLVFPTSLEESDAPHASKWFTLMRSEQALVEASMAIAIGCGSNDSPAQFSQKGTMHTYRAVKIISRKLNRGSLELTDGLLAAVFTLSYSEVRVDSPQTRQRINDVASEEQSSGS